MTTDSPGRFAQLGRRLDETQQRHPVLGFPIAVGMKYGDDEGIRHAALLTYYGFLSIIPLLLLVVAVLTEVLRGDPELRNQIITAIVPPQFTATVEAAFAALPSSGLPLVLSIVGLLVTSLGIVNSAFHTLNQVAAVPRRMRAPMHLRYLRVVIAVLLLLLCAIGIGVLAVLTGSLDSVPTVARIASALGTVVLTFLLLWGTAALLLPRGVRLSSVWPAALTGALVITGILALAASVLPHLIARAGAGYGSFATIVGIFTLLFVLGQVLVIAAEIAVVRRRRLWPRSLDPARPTDADRRALTALARAQERLPSERVSATFDPVG